MLIYLMGGLLVLLDELLVPVVGGGVGEGGLVVGVDVSVPRPPLAHHGSEQVMKVHGALMVHFAWNIGKD